jgi:Domain of unknown function (DUF4232)
VRILLAGAASRSGVRLLLVAAALVASVTWLSAGSADAGRGRAFEQVVFYADVANTVPGTSFLKNVPRVRPITVLLIEDGSSVLEKLQWSSWGGSVARATGILSASSCVPNCAQGKRTNDPVQFVVSQRRHLFGRTVYSCYQLTDPKAPQIYNDCLKHAQGNQYYYSPVAAGAPVSPCASQQLTISLGTLSAASGRMALPIRFRNKGAACSLRGFPTVYGLSNRGRVIIRAKPSLEGNFGHWHIATITLKNGQAASALLEGIDPIFLSHPPLSSRIFGISPPNASRSVRLRTKYAISDLLIHPIVAGLKGGGR